MRGAAREPDDDLAIDHRQWSGLVPQAHELLARGRIPADVLVGDALLRKKLFLV
jgi:hypothetical protein